MQCIVVGRKRRIRCAVCVPRHLHLIKRASECRHTESCYEQQSKPKKQRELQTLWLRASQTATSPHWKAVAKRWPPGCQAAHIPHAPLSPPLARTSLRCRKSATSNNNSSLILADLTNVLDCLQSFHDVVRLRWQKCGTAYVIPEVHDNTNKDTTI